ncbi:hypothetical protein ABBQ32_010985 [Trebouxia sp. C0010 RCD-2024]
MSPGSAGCILGSSEASSSTSSKSVCPRKPLARGRLRYRKASEHPIAAALQGHVAEQGYRYHESAQSLSRKRWQAMTMQQGKRQMCLVIGAGQLGKYAGFSCYPEAQAEAFEDLMQQHDPAGWQAALACQSQLTEAQKAQRTIQQLPELVQAKYHSAMQLTGSRFEHMPHAKQQCSTAHQSLESDLLRLRNTKDISQRSESACALGQSDSSSAEAFAGSIAATTTLETDSTDSEEAPASYLEPSEAASTATDEAALHLASSQAASTASEDAASQLAASEATSTASDLSLSTLNTDTADDAAVTSNSTSGGSSPQSGASYTQADIDQVLSYLTQQTYTAYGVPTERDAVRELDSEAGLAQEHGWEWHKMGAPDNVHIGTYYGIDFELDCQVDGALVKNQKAAPAEIKNRMHRFRNQLPEQELVQVQCQLQLCEAQQGVLIERLETNGVAQARWHSIHRDDQYWNTRVLPHLHAFVQVFAGMATESGGFQLSSYLDARREGRHQSFLQKLVLQQLSPCP